MESIFQRYQNQIKLYHKAPTKEQSKVNDPLYNAPKHRQMDFADNNNNNNRS